MHTVGTGALLFLADLQYIMDLLKNNCLNWIDFSFASGFLPLIVTSVCSWPLMTINFIYVGLLVFHFTGKGKDVGVALVKTLQNPRYSLDEKLEQSFINFFGGRPAAQSKDSDAQGNVISASQDNQSDTNILQQVDDGNNSNAVTMESNEHSEGSSDSEGDNDDIQLRDRDVDLREEVEICNGRLRRRAVSANFRDDFDDEVYCFLLFPCHE